MTTHTNYQRIFSADGAPLYVLVPYDEFQRLPIAHKDGYIPNEVVGKRIMEEKTMLQAWREHLMLTQEEMATRMGISQAGYAQIEAAKKPRKATLEKAAAALGISLGQLAY